MKTVFLSTLLMLALSFASRAQQFPIASEPGYDMKQYWFVMLSKGPNRTHNQATAQKIQQAHLQNIERLAKAGKILVAGPFADDGNWRGIFIFDCPDSLEVKRLLDTDSAIASGRLRYEIHPWWTAKGGSFK